MTEMQAKGVTGYLLYDPRDGRHWFRVYSEDRKSHTDYQLRIEDLEVTIAASSASLFIDDNGKNYVGWSSKCLGQVRKEQTET